MRPGCPAVVPADETDKESAHLLFTRAAMCVLEWDAAALRRFDAPYMDAHTIFGLVASQRAIYRAYGGEACERLVFARDRLGVHDTVVHTVFFRLHADRPRLSKAILGLLYAGVGDDRLFTPKLLGRLFMTKVLKFAQSHRDRFDRLVATESDFETVTEDWPPSMTCRLYFQTGMCETAPMTFGAAMKRWGDRVFSSGMQRNQRSAITDRELQGVVAILVASYAPNEILRFLRTLGRTIDITASVGNMSATLLEDLCSAAPGIRVAADATRLDGVDGDKIVLLVGFGVVRFNSFAEVLELGLSPIDVVRVCAQTQEIQPDIDWWTGAFAGRTRVLMDPSDRRDAISMLHESLVANGLQLGPGAGLDLAQIAAIFGKDAPFVIATDMSVHVVDRRRVTLYQAVDTVFRDNDYMVSSFVRAYGPFAYDDIKRTLADYPSCAAYLRTYSALDLTTVLNGPVLTVDWAGIVALGVMTMSQVTRHVWHEHRVLVVDRETLLATFRKDIVHLKCMGRETYAKLFGACSAQM